MRGRIFKLAAAAVLCCQVGACASLTDEDISAELAGGISDTSSFGSLPEAVWLEKAKQNYRNGNYGLAERFYRQSIEEQPRNIEAWLGLAASYDRLKRFDLAEKAYDVVIKLAGRTPTVLNNLAYHEMLKGNLVLARRHLEEADRADPGNPHVKSNMQLLMEFEANAGRA
jgi:Flp pilus assembly protein TadD